ncbi:MAG: type II toxin-antitoxin system ParD family antitoxin [Pseudomonadota bacterium]
MIATEISNVIVCSMENAATQDGHYPDLSGVVQRGLELVRAETIRDRSEILALRTFFEERAAGTFLSDADIRVAVERMNAAKLAQHGV